MKVYMVYIVGDDTPSIQ